MSLGEIVFRLHYVTTAMPARDRNTRLLLIITASLTALIMAFEPATPLRTLLLAISGVMIAAVIGELLVQSLSNRHFEIIPPEGKGEGEKDR